MIDPIAAAKRQVVGMFVRWFSPNSSVETRELAAKLASSPALRRNPEVRKAIAAYVENETVNTIRRRLENLLASDDERYGDELRKLIEAQDESKGDDRKRLTSLSSTSCISEITSSPSSTGSASAMAAPASPATVFRGACPRYI